MLFEVTSAVLDPQRLIDHVRKDESGAVTLFSGVVRNENLGRRVLYLEYDSYQEMAERVRTPMADTEPAAPTEPTAPTESTPSPASPTRESIRAELEATKTQYHALRNSLSEEDWKQKSGNPSWNVRQLMWHMSWANGYTMQGVESCRKGKGTNPPNWIADFGNTWITRIGSRGATRESVGEKYDEAHAKVLAALAGVQE